MHALVLVDADGAKCTWISAISTEKAPPDDEKTPCLTKLASSWFTVMPCLAICCWKCLLRIESPMTLCKAYMAGTTCLRGNPSETYCHDSAMKRVSVLPQREEKERLHLLASEREAKSYTKLP